MADLSDLDQKIEELVRRYPEINDDKAALEQAASEIGVAEDELRDRITDLKQQGLGDDERGRRDDSDLLVFARVFGKNRRFIFINFVIVFLLSAVISLIMPKTYRVTATIMPPPQQQNLGILNEITGSLPMGGLNFGQMSNEGMTLLAILNSRTVKEDVIRKFNLMQFYDVETMEDAVENLEGNTWFDFEDEGTISITADVSTGWFSGKEETERVKRLVTDIANYFIADLDSTNKRLKTEQARYQRLFVEKRYEQNIGDLRETEEKLKAFQEENHMMALPEQTEAAINAAATLEARILADAVRLGVLTKSLSPSHPEIERVRSEIAELRSKLKEMETGTAGKGVFPGFSEVPDLGIQLMRLQRDLKTQNTLFTFLTQQYEEAKIQEAKDTPTLQVIDWAVKPEKKHKPHRTIFVLFFSFLSIILSSLYVIYKPVFARLWIS